mmetsp:Transcript_25983/g.85450  ORF Transcript_25983/g.85450 Transcript_25983/m.85450 type:complete len:278 (-) Transcript_25983:1384-2217(-)
MATRCSATSSRGSSTPRAATPKGGSTSTCTATSRLRGRCSGCPRRSPRSSPATCATPPSSDRSLRTSPTTFSSRQPRERTSCARGARSLPCSRSAETRCGVTRRTRPTTRFSPTATPSWARATRKATCSTSSGARTRGRARRRPTSPPTSRCGSSSTGSGRSFSSAPSQLGRRCRRRRIVATATEAARRRGLRSCAICTAEPLRQPPRRQSRPAPLTRRSRTRPTSSSFASTASANPPSARTTTPSTTRAATTAGTARAAKATIAAAVAAAAEGRRR